MIVVSNTSPVMNLAMVGALDLLGSLYGEVWIPEAVAQELSTLSTSPIFPSSFALPSWVTIHPVQQPSMVLSLVNELHRGEAEAIVLALEVSAGLILLDERRARQVAARLGLRMIGLLGVLVAAKRRGCLVAVKPVVDALIVQAGFWVSRPL